MKRFFFICVALIAFAATNASGTNYQPTDQLQTHYQVNHPIVIMPALNVVDFVLSTPATNAITLYQPEKGQVLFKPLGYCNPEYGLYNKINLNRYIDSYFRPKTNYCSLNSHTKTNTYNLLNYSNHKLPTQFVQLE